MSTAAAAKAAGIQRGKRRRRKKKPQSNHTHSAQKPYFTKARGREKWNIGKHLTLAHSKENICILLLSRFNHSRRTSRKGENGQKRKSLGQGKKGMGFSFFPPPVFISIPFKKLKWRQHLLGEKSRKWDSTLSPAQRQRSIQGAKAWKGQQMMQLKRVKEAKIYWMA